MRKLITNVAGIFAAAACFAFACPAMAFADEEGARTGAALLIPQVGEIVPMVIGFLLLLVILGKFGWPAFIGMIDKRTAAIKESLETAENNKVESERILAEHKAELADAKKQAAEIIAQAKQTAEGVKADITAKAQVEAEGMIAKARTAIEAEKRAALAELQASTADLTIQVAGRVIGEDLSDADHRKIIEHYLAEAGSFDVN